ncbi:SpoIIE family protein phosphatase, partial [candidate division KSB1 bacterium]|nr:SpoIIE family protein phosphatase [candidate division KSB1 bacterium]
ILSLIIFFAYLVGDSRYHASASRNSSWLLSFDAILKTEWLNRNVAQSMNNGFWMGALLLGTMTIVMYVFTNYLNVYIEHYTFVEAIDKFFPWLTPIFNSLITIFTLIIVCLFGLNFMITKYLKYKFFGFLPFIIILFVTSHLNINFYPHTYNFIYNGVLGLFLIGIFIKFDFLTTVITSFVFSIFILAQPLMNTNNAFLVVSGFSATIIGFTPLFFAFLGFRTNRFFEIKKNELPAYIKRITERERIARELEIARNIQLKLLPQNAPRFADFDISGMCLPAQEVGGDYFEFITLNDHQFGIGIADVSGKGVPAAIYMTLTKGIFLSYCEENFSPKMVLSKVNRMLYRIMSRDHFVSMFYGIIDTKTMSLTYSRAGHNPGIWYHRNEGQLNLLQPAGMALGLERGDLFEKTLVEEKINLFPGDTLAFYTDGFSEMQNDKGDEFGETRLTTLMQQNVAFSAKKIIQNILAEISAFANQKSQLDDMTMVVVQIKPSEVA